MKKIHLNRKLFAIHSWLGLLLGILYVLIAVSGASVVFKNELNQLIYGNKIKIGPRAGKKLSYDQLEAIAKREYPNAMYVGFDKDPMHPENAPQIFGTSLLPGFFDECKAQWDYIDPYTGKIIMRTSYMGGMTNVMGWLNYFHQSLHLGNGGYLIVALVSIAVLLSLITGAIFYRKHILDVLLFRVKIKFKNWRTASSDLHRVIGTWALLINLLIFGSGLYMNKFFFTPSYWKEYQSPKIAALIHEETISIDTLVARSKKIFPDFDVMSVSAVRDTSRIIAVNGATHEKVFFETHDNSMATVIFNTNGKLVNQYAPKKMADLTFGEKFESINYSLFHTGAALGIPGKIIWTIFGFAPAFLSITGFMLWWRKKSTSVKLKQRSYEP